MNYEIGTRDISSPFSLLLGLPTFQHAFQGASSSSSFGSATLSPPIFCCCTSTHVCSFQRGVTPSPCDRDARAHTLGANSSQGGSFQNQNGLSSSTGLGSGAQKGQGPTSRVLSKMSTQSPAPARVSFPVYVVVSGVAGVPSLPSDHRTLTSWWGGAASLASDALFSDLLAARTPPPFRASPLWSPSPRSLSRKGSLSATSAVGAPLSGRVCSHRNVTMLRRQELVEAEAEGGNHDGPRYTGKLAILRKYDLDLQRILGLFEPYEQR